MSNGSKNETMKKEILMNHEKHKNLIDVNEVRSLKSWLIDQLPEVDQVANFSLEEKVKLAWEITTHLSDRVTVDCEVVNDCHEQEKNQSEIDDTFGKTQPAEFRCGTSQSDAKMEPNRISDEIANSQYNECFYILGCKLYQLFSGQCIDKQRKQDTIESIQGALQKLESPCEWDKEESSSKRGNFTQKSLFYEEMKNMNLPTSLCSLISTLIEPDTAAYRYESFSEVAHDLYVMTKDPVRYLHDPDVGKLRGKLDIPKDRVYGRTKEISYLMDTYHRVFAEGIPEIALICGYSGTGKSYMANQIKEVMAKNGGYFLTGKFQQLTNSNPLSVLVSAFNEYCELLLERKSECFETVKANITAALGSDSKVLTDLIPKLTEVIGIPRNPSKKLEGPKEVNRRDRLLKMFVNAISSSSGPIVLFLDDLQWTDEETLNTTQLLVSGRDVSPILLIGCYRDSEVGNDHPLLAYIRRMEQLKVNITKIKIDNMGKDDTNDLLSATLCLSPIITRPFTNVVYRKTSGNPLFVVEFIKAIHKDGLLSFSLKNRQWHWDIKSIEFKTVAHNVVELMKLKMMKLPEKVQQTLMVASCLGSQSELSFYDHLTEFFPGRELNFLDSLQIAVDEGLMDKFGNKFRFSHDEIERAAYALIPDNIRPSWHLRIGKLLRQANLDKGATDISTCQAARQMNLGISLVDSKADKSSLAKFNLEAGKLSVSTVSFSAALNFFTTGLSLLDDDDWNNDNYNLILELTNASIETYHILGVYTCLEEMVQRVLTKAVSFEDKLSAYFVSIKALGSSFRIEEALTAGLRVLDQLGVSFPPSIDQATVDHEFHTTRLTLDGFSEDKLPNLPDLTDEKTMIIFKFMMRLFHVSYFHDTLLFQVLVLRFVRLSLEFGVCSYSAYGFSCYGIILCLSGDYASGYRFGKIGLNLIKRFNATSLIPIVVCTVSGLINIWSEPFELTRQSLLDSLDVAKKVGDTQFFAANCCHYIKVSLLGGRKLETSLSEEYDMMTHTMIETKQELFFVIFSSWKGAFPILRGKGDDKISSVFIDIERLQRDVSNLSNGTPSLVLVEINGCMIWLNFLFGRYEDACMNMSVLEGLFGIMKGHLVEFCYFVFGGLSTLNVARVSHGRKREKFRKIAQKCIDTVNNWAGHFPWNFQHYLELLNAEWYHLEHEIKSAATNFSAAIKTASEKRLVYELALIYERAALFNKAIDDVNKAREYFNEAQKLYQEWGSVSKFTHIKTQLLSLSPS